MSKKDGILDLPIKKIWFEKIKSGEKTHEYRRVSKHWCEGIGTSPYRLIEGDGGYDVEKIRFRCGQTTKAADKEKAHRSRGWSGGGVEPSTRNAVYCEEQVSMLFEIKSISCIDGKETDLKYDGLVFDIELGKEIECLKLTQ